MFAMGGSEREVDAVVPSKNILAEWLGITRSPQFAPT